MKYGKWSEIALNKMPDEVSPYFSEIASLFYIIYGFLKYCKDWAVLFCVADNKARRNRSASFDLSPDIFKVGKLTMSFNNTIILTSHSKTFSQACLFFLCKLASGCSSSMIFIYRYENYNTFKIRYSEGANIYV